MAGQMVKIPHKIVVAVMARVRVGQGRNGESGDEHHGVEAGGFHESNLSSSRAKLQSVPATRAFDFCRSGFTPDNWHWVSGIKPDLHQLLHSSLLQLLRDEFLANGLG